VSAIIRYTVIEDALIAKIAANNLFKKVDVYQGERGEEFINLSRQVGASVWVRCERALLKPQEFVQATGLGEAFNVGLAGNREELTWSLFVLAKSLRSPAELGQGATGVTGLYQMLNVLIGPPNAAPATSGQVRGYQAASYAEPFTIVGWEILGQSMTAVVAQLLVRTRVQL
jgi:hypothetical protein